MEITIRLSRPALIVLLVLTLTLGFSSSQAIAQTPVQPEQEASLLGGGPVPGGPGYVSLSPFDFIPSELNTTSFTRGGGYLCNGTAITQFFAPVHLPDRARVTQVVMYYKDNAADGYVSVYLYMHPLLSNSLYNMAIVASTPPEKADTFTFAATPNISSAYSTVNLSINSYLVYLTLYAYFTPATVCLTGVRIDYTYDTNLPAVMKGQ
jgi:hypothetical protein